VAEAFHSTADSGNELLLLWGIRRSARPPDSLHPFGHGKVLYFYSLLVAVYIFGIGGVLAVRQGLVRFRQPEPFTHIGWNYIVLAVAFALDFYSWRISYKELLARKDPDESTWQEIIGSKDPTVFTIFLERLRRHGWHRSGIPRHFLRACAGAPFFRCSGLNHHWGLACRRRGPAGAGKRTNRSRIRRIRAIICADDSVDNVGDLLTMQLGPDQVLLNVDIRFNRGLGVQELESAIDRIEKNIRQSDPTVQRIFIEVDSLRTASSRTRPATEPPASSNRRKANSN
jgi:divalent metal cation (Fe/Co/Zn/Cd) transporter